MDAMKEMKVAFDFLLTKKANIAGRSSTGCLYEGISLCTYLGRKGRRM